MPPSRLKNAKKSWSLSCTANAMCQFSESVSSCYLAAFKWKVRAVLESSSLEKAGAGEEAGGGVAQLGGGNRLLHRFGDMAVSGFFSESNTLMSTTPRHSP